MTKVSIIVPCFNQAGYLPKAIASLQAQTLTSWECIIVDDGSTDNTAEVAANIALKDNRIRLIQQLNGGSASARDRGLNEAKGEFIQFLDADDTLAPEKLERQVTFMEQDGQDISYTAFCSENSQGQRTKPQVHALSLCKILTMWGLGASTPIHAFLYRTDFIRQHDLQFQSACRVREDWKWHIACFTANPKQAVLPDYCGAVYYQNDEGKTGSYVKMQEGNFVFMTYMSGQLKGMMTFLWALRISEELWMWLLRMLKYHSTASGKTIAPLMEHTCYMLAAILLMPISFWFVVVYFIKTYLVK